MVIIVPMHIEKMHHTKTIYKIIEKPVHVDTSNKLSGQTGGQQHLIVKHGFVRNNNNNNNIIDAKLIESAHRRPDLAGNGGNRPVGSGHETAIYSGLLGDKQLKATSGHGYNQYGGHGYGFRYRDGYTRNEQHNTFSGYRAGFPNLYYSSQSGQTGKGDAFAGSVVNGDHVDENKSNSGYRVKENVADSSSTAVPPHMNILPQQSSAVNRNNYYSTSSSTGQASDGRDSLDGMSSDSVVTMPPQIIENVYYTLDPVVPYETAH